MDLVFGELAAAGAHFDEALSLAASVRYPFGVIAALQSLAQLTIADGRPDAADRLFKSTAKLRQIVGDDANDVEMPRSTSARAGSRVDFH